MLTGVANDLNNVIQENQSPRNWKFLSDFCFQQKKDIKILDVGCGTGNIMLFLMEKGFKNSVGLEYNKDAYSFMKKKHQDLKIFNGDAENLHLFEDKSFDLVFCNQVLEHLPNPESAIKEANRVLKNNGIYIIGIPNGKHLNDRLMKIIQKIYYKRSDHIQTFSEKGISLLLEKNCFKIIKIENRMGSLEIFLDRRIKNIFSASIYSLLKKIYWKEISFDIMAKKEQ